jgi:hypothetical protein
MKKYLSITVLVVLVAALLSGCGGGGGGSAAPSSPVNFLAAGGVGATGFGGDGGRFYIETAGTVTVRGSGSVDASFASAVSEPTPSFGPVHAIVSGGTTTVLLDADNVPNNLCMNSTDLNGTIYEGDASGVCGDAGDSIVTGVTVNAGATLVLIDAGVTLPIYDHTGYGTLIVSHDVVVNGTIISNPTNTYGIEIDPNTLFIGSTGKLTTSSTALNAAAKDISIGYNDNTNAIYNHGTIEAKGLGSGSGGYVGMWANDLAVNYGSIDTSGGSSATGSGGNGTFSPGSNSIEIFVYYGNFYSSGAVRMNGGRGGNGTGGDAGLALIETADLDNSNGQNGDIFISGTWEAMGGEGVNGNGGSVNFGALRFLTDAMGKVALNAAITLSGGKGSGALSSGGGGGSILITSRNLGSVEVAVPGSIRLSGTFDVRGGDGSQEGGAGGSLEVAAIGANIALKGCDVELLGFPVISLNGGNGVDGGSGNANAFEIYTYAPQYPDVSTSSTNTTVAAGAIVNEANVFAKGGAAAGATGTGGTGGYAEMIANVDFGFPLVANATTVIKNSGSFDVSGGNGYVGGGTVLTSITGYSLYFEAYRVTSSGKLAATGGNGTTVGGAGGDITIWSKTLTTLANLADMNVSGGTGATPGAAGTKVITH